MSEATRKILILGGYGVFGGRLAQLLVNEIGVTLMLAGRSLEKALFPRAARGASTSVRFEAREGVETWTRIFAGRIMRSRQSQGEGRWEGLLCETFGPFTFGLAVLTGDGRLRLVLRRWTFLGLPLPIWLAPQGHAIESEQDGRFRFDVAIRLPLIGPIVRYRGWLAPD
jgi:hypothetical protein